MVEVVGAESASRGLAASTARSLQKGDLAGLEKRIAGVALEEGLCRILVGDRYLGGIRFI